MKHNLSSMFSVKVRGKEIEHQVKVHLPVLIRIGRVWSIDSLQPENLVHDTRVKALASPDFDDLVEGLYLQA